MARIVSLPILWLSFFSQQAHAETKEKSVTGAFALSGAGLVIPLVVGGTIAGLGWETSFRGYGDQGTTMLVSGLSIMSAGLTWGTSLGYWYGGDGLYGTLAGAGKTALLGSTLLYRLLDHKGSGSTLSSTLLAVGFVGTLVWDVVDLALLVPSVQQENAKRRQLNTMSILPSLNIKSNAFEFAMVGNW